MAPKVSVIAPNYNYAAFLNQRLDSILTQTYQDFELIILDDCSTDCSREIIEQYRDNPHVSHIVYNEKNTGSPFVQWDKGIRLARGEWLWIAECDDFADKRFLESLMSLIDMTPNAVLAFTHSYFVDSDGKDLGTNLHKENGCKSCAVDGERFVRDKMLWRNYIFNASMVLFKKSVYDGLDKSYTQFRSCGDWLFWVQVCLNGAVIEDYELLNSYRQHNKKTTALAGRTGNDWREVSEILREFIRILSLSGLLLRAFRGQWTKHLRESGNPSKEELYSSFPDVYGGNSVDIFCYRMGKFLRCIKC